jgi:hypothetical protein
LNDERAGHARFEHRCRAPPEFAGRSSRVGNRIRRPQRS